MKSASYCVWKVPTDWQALPSAPASAPPVVAAAGSVERALATSAKSAPPLSSSTTAWASASVSSRMWLTHSAPVPAGSSRYCASRSSADGAVSWDSDWTAAAPATTSSCMDCGSLAAVGLLAIWPWMVSIDSWVVESPCWLRRSSAVFQVMT